MSKGLARKLLILLVGVLLVLLGLLYQLKQNSQSSPKTTLSQQDLSGVLSASLLQQRRYFQRCWLRQNLPVKTPGNQDFPHDITWQIFLKISSNGKVKDFSLLNKSLYDAETEKCLREISYRLKFPSFEGEDISISVPIVISNTSESR